MCCRLILKIPHIPGKFLLPNRLLLFIVQHGWQRPPAPLLLNEWKTSGMKNGIYKKKENPEIWNDCNEGYFRDGALFVFNEHLPVRCSSGHTAEWMASLWECRSFKQPLVNTLRLCPLWTRQQQTEPLFWSFQREKNCTVVLKPRLLYFILSFTCATAARETMMKVDIAAKLLELVQ